MPGAAFRNGNERGNNMGTLMNRVADSFTQDKTFDDYSVVVRTQENNYKIWYDGKADIYQCDCDEISDESLEAIVDALEQLIERKGETITAVELV